MGFVTIQTRSRQLKSISNMIMADNFINICNLFYDEYHVMSSASESL